MSTTSLPGAQGRTYLCLLWGLSSSMDKPILLQPWNVQPHPASIRMEAWRFLADSIASLENYLALALVVGAWYTHSAFTI